MATFEPTTYSDDDTHLDATNLLYAIKHMHESSKLFGKDMTSSPTWKDRMEKAGFVNVREDIYKVCAVLFFRWRNFHAYCCIVAPKSMAERPEAERARSIPSTQHDRSYASLHICLVHTNAGLVTGRDRGVVSRNTEGAAEYIPSSVHKSADCIWSEMRVRIGLFSHVFKSLYPTNRFSFSNHLCEGEANHGVNSATCA